MSLYTIQGQLYTTLYSDTKIGHQACRYNESRLYCTCALEGMRAHNLLKCCQGATVEGITTNNDSDYIAEHESYVLIWILQELCN
jgi:hypothetical protein